MYSHTNVVDMFHYLLTFSIDWWGGQGANQFPAIILKKKKFKYLRLINPFCFDGFSQTDKSNKDAFVYYMGHAMTKGNLQCCYNQNLANVNLVKY